ncbi:MAG: CPBP family intramembrane metalloprotease [Planctomycetota bacterium]|nr:CPBP family intramembrane metalloprotease [Planctomycetota bacterium]
MMSALAFLPALPAEHFEPVVVLVSVTVFYLAAHFGCSQKNFETLLSGRFSEAKAQAYSVYCQRLFGGLILGVGPLLVLLFGIDGGCPLAAGFTMPNDLMNGLLFALIGSVVLTPILYFNAKNSEHQKHYPEIRDPNWTWGRWSANLATWVIYLVAYEFFIRGFLLLTMVKFYGVWPGIMMMNAFYVAIHLPKGAGEAIGCAPMGVVFGLSAVLLESIFPAALLHIVISNCNAIFCIRANPEMSFNRSPAPVNE